MPLKDDTASQRQRAAFDKVIGYTETRLQVTAPSLNDVRTNAEHDIWSLFSNGLRHLKEGAPQGQPGSMAEALTRVSLRSAPLAASIGIKPPHFEPIYFSIDHQDSDKAAFSFSIKLVEIAETDFPKSRQIIQQKILMEKPSLELKEQIVLAFDALTNAYPLVCQDLKEFLKA